MNPTDKDQIERMREVLHTLPSPAELAQQIVSVDPINSDAFRSLQYIMRVPPRYTPTKPDATVAEVLEDWVERVRGYSNDTEPGFYPVEIEGLNGDASEFIETENKVNYGWYEEVHPVGYKGVTIVDKPEIKCPYIPDGIEEYMREEHGIDEVM